jgi:hypothetical protein
MDRELGLNGPPPPAIAIVAVLVALQPGEGLGLALGEGLALGDGLAVGEGLTLGEGDELGVCACRLAAKSVMPTTTAICRLLVILMISLRKQPRLRLLFA